MRYVSHIGKKGVRIEYRSKRPKFFPLSGVRQAWQTGSLGRTFCTSHCARTAGADPGTHRRVPRRVRLLQVLPGADTRRAEGRKILL